MRAGAVGNRTDNVAHAVTGHHIARDFRCAFQIVGSTGRNIAEVDFFAHTAAEQHHKIVEHGLLRTIGAVFLRQRHRKAAGHTARNDGDLMHGVLPFQIIGCDCVTGFVNSCELLFLIGYLGRTEKAGQFRI